MKNISEVLAEPYKKYLIVEGKTFAAPKCHQINSQSQPVWASSVQSVKEPPKCGFDYNDALRCIIWIWWGHKVKFNVLPGYSHALKSQSFCLHQSPILHRNRTTLSTGFMATLAHHSYFLFNWVFQFWWSSLDLTSF